MAGKSIKKVNVDKYRLLIMFNNLGLSYKDVGKMCSRGASSISRYLSCGEMPLQVAMDIANGLSVELRDISPKGFSKKELRDFINILNETERKYILERL